MTTPKKPPMSARARAVLDRLKRAAVMGLEGRLVPLYRPNTGNERRVSVRSIG